VNVKMPPAFRLAGPAAAYGRGRVAVEIREDAPAVAVALGPEDATDLASVARALPEADTLEAGTMVVVLPHVVDPSSLASLASRVLAVLGRGRTVPRAHRCSALLARGYVRIGACVDPETKLDLAYGFVPATTGPC
jgi:hypothetical protein